MIGLFRTKATGDKIQPKQVYYYNRAPVSPIPIDVDFEVSYDNSSQVDMYRF